MKNAIVSCSGGIDSVVTANYVKKKLNYKNLTILFFNYGQRNLTKERYCSKKCSRALKAKFVEINLPELKNLSGSLINNNKKFKEIGRNELKDVSSEIKKWYVPNRNAIFLSYALGLAESLFITSKKAHDIFVGFKYEGKDGYPDTSKKFIRAFNNLSNISTKGHYKIFAPLINLDKESIILLGKKLGVDFKNTFSCYTGKSRHCKKCLACALRKEGFYWANLQDPAP